MLKFESYASGSNGNCYFATDGITNIMIECGLSINRIKKGCDFKIHEIAACFISHGH